MPESAETAADLPVATNAPVETAPAPVVSPNGASATSPLPPSRPRRRATSRRAFILPLAALALLVAAYFAYSFWQANLLFVSTDDALVDANLVAIAAPASGTLTNWRIKPGDSVRAGQVIGAVRTAPTGGALATVNITAPQDGTVLKVDGKAGQIIGTAQAIAYLADLSALTVTAYINESDVGRVHAGQAVEITVDGTGSVQYDGVVTEVIPATASEFALIQTQDRSTGNFTKVVQRVEVHVDLGDTSGSALYPGMNAQVRIHVR